jgi:hypothetical protein
MSFPSPQIQSASYKLMEELPTNLYWNGIAYASYRFYIGW